MPRDPAPVGFMDPRERLWALSGSGRDRGIIHPVCLSLLENGMKAQGPACLEAPAEQHAHSPN